MAHHNARIEWQRGEARFTDNRYSRAHLWSFDGGVRVPASSCPSVVPVPLSDPGAVDPEEAFVAALASCHMLWFLSIAAKRGFVVDRYEDDAVGELATNHQGLLAMKTVTLRPAVIFGPGSRPTREVLESLHHEAHDACYLSNSVRSEIRIEPVLGHNLGA
jgi:organic hydroperoxide reductase OsmC/OhrA